MRMAKAFIAAVPLALALVAAVVVPLAFSAASGTFGFDSWPSSPAAPPRDNAVVIEQPLALSDRAQSLARSRPTVVRDDAARPHASATTSHGPLVAQVDRGAPRPITQPPSGDSGAGQRSAGGPHPSSGALVEVPNDDAPAP